MAIEMKMVSELTKSTPTQGIRGEPNLFGN
jgi:hypothetical protein